MEVALHNCGIRLKSTVQTNQWAVQALFKLKLGLEEKCPYFGEPPGCSSNACGLIESGSPKLSGVVSLPKSLSVVDLLIS